MRVGDGSQDAPVGPRNEDKLAMADLPARLREYFLLKDAISHRAAAPCMQEQFISTCHQLFSS